MASASEIGKAGNGDGSRSGSSPTLPAPVTGGVSDGAPWDEHEYLVQVSYLEVYNEEVNDLLQDPGHGRGANLRILRDDPVKGAVVEGLTEKVCTER